jgi:hypothetical protein
MATIATARQGKTRTPDTIIEKRHDGKAKIQNTMPTRIGKTTIGVTGAHGEEHVQQGCSGVVLLSGPLNALSIFLDAVFITRTMAAAVKRISAINGTPYKNQHNPRIASHLFDFNDAHATINETIARMEK